MSDTEADVQTVTEALFAIWPEHMAAETKSGLQWGQLIATAAVEALKPSGDDTPTRGSGMTLAADDGITDEMVERAAYPIFVGVAKAPWTSRDDDEPCPVQPFTKNHARNIARVALTEALRHAR